MHAYYIGNKIFEQLELKWLLLDNQHIIIALPSILMATIEL